MSDANDLLMGPRIHRFVARFDSECEECLRDIYEGDEAGYIEGEVYCSRCCDGAEHDDEP